MRNNLGVTLVELLVILGVLVILFWISAQAFSLFQKELGLSNSAEEIINTLRLARNKTLASERASQYGVFFDTSTEQHQYTLFKGLNYIGRDGSFDEVYKLPQSIEIHEINLGGGSEVVFNRLTGTANQSGKISIRLKDNPSKFKTISIQSSGQVVSGEAVSPTDTDRVKDSRHLHFNYSRAIDTLTESLTLTFTYDASITIQDVVIANNMKDGQIYWEGEVDVGGQTQKLKIHTHRLNNSDTLFSIHRDRRFNNRALAITISGDASGNLVGYSADGLNTTFTSIFVSNLVWQ